MWRWRPRAAALVERVTGLPTRPALAATGRWLFNSRTMRDETLATGLEVRDAGVLTPGIELAYLRAPREDPPPPWRWRLLYLGRVVPQKGVLTAVQSLALLPEQATLRIVGDGDAPYRRELEQTAERLGVAGRIRFEPARPREEMFATYRESDALLFPVQWPEPFGLVPLEAMALGRPVIATGRGGSGDYLRDGENALLFEAGNARGLACAIQRLAREDALRHRLRQHGFQTAAQHGEDRFNREAVAEMTAAVERGASSARR
jgi:glycosyltransferase involved in cell wall biosynthesis